MDGKNEQKMNVKNFMVNLIMKRRCEINLKIFKNGVTGVNILKLTMQNLLQKFAMNM